MLCTHYECRCDAAHKLTMQGLTERAIEVHERQVRCILSAGRKCPAHLLPEPCETCGSYIAAGL